MKSKVGVIYCLAVFKPDVITNLETEAVSVVVTGNNIPETLIVARLDKDTA